MTKFWELLEESVLVSGIIALALIGSVCYLSIAQQPIPELLNNACMVVVGFFFGKGAQLSVHKTVQKMRGVGKHG